MADCDMCRTDLVVARLFAASGAEEVRVKPDGPATRPLARVAQAILVPLLEGDAAEARIGRDHGSVCMWVRNGEEWQERMRMPPQMERPLMSWFLTMAGMEPVAGAEGTLRVGWREGIRHVTVTFATADAGDEIRLRAAG